MMASIEDPASSLPLLKDAMASVYTVAFHWFTCSRIAGFYECQLAFIRTLSRVSSGRRLHLDQKLDGAVNVGEVDRSVGNP
jgi:hypothetical protein